MFGFEKAREMKKLSSIVIAVFGIVVLSAFASLLILKKPANPRVFKGGEKTLSFEAADFYALKNEIFKKSTGERVFGASEDFEIASFAFEGDCVYFSDAFKKRVYKFSRKGELIWESRGERRFVIPNHKFSLSLSPEGDLWVANTGLKRLENLDKSTGKFVASWEPAKGSEFLGCCNPIAFAAVGGGRFACMEKGTKKIKIFSPSGESKIIDELSADWSNYAVKFNAETSELFYFDGAKNVRLKLED